MSEKKRTRSFLAIPMEEPALLSLVQLQQQLHQALPAARVMPQNQLHITLAFLGDSTESQLQKAEDIIRHLPVLDVVLHGQNLRLYGNALVLRLAPSAVLEEYVMKLQDALRQAGFSLEKRTWIPHITLLRKVNTVPAAADFQNITIQADCVCLYASRLTDQGAVYTKLYLQKAGQS